MAPEPLAATGQGPEPAESLILHDLWHTPLVRQVGNHWLKAGCVLSYLPHWEFI